MTTTTMMSAASACDAPASVRPGSGRSAVGIGKLHWTMVLSIMALAAIGLNSVTQALQLHFKKLPMAMRAAFDDPALGLPAHIGPWVQISRDMPLDPETHASLGTDAYLYRSYADTRVIPPEEIDAILKADADTRDQAVNSLMAAHPNAVVYMGLTYYTGSVDTVPHVPEVCYVAHGFAQSSPSQQMTWQVHAPLTSDGTIPVRVSQFTGLQAGGVVTNTVAYFFQTQGVYVGDPWGARLHMQDLRQRYDYFSKVELMTQMKDRDQSAAVTSDFLTYALPFIERCLPDWSQYEQKKG